MTNREAIGHDGLRASQVLQSDPNHTIWYYLDLVLVGVTRERSLSKILHPLLHITHEYKK